MRLSTLLERVALSRWPIAADVIVPAGADPDPELLSLTHDSRLVANGSLFCCISGAKVDGHRFASDAARAGARALLVARSERTSPPVVQLVVDDTRAAMGPLAAAFHRFPSDSIEVVGVTGTNGKTTTTHLLAAILRSVGRATEVIGTLSGPRTTPDATELAAQLGAMRDRGVAAVVMEVSSHALALRRVDGTRFRVGVFTNLSQDHLDFHGTMEAYFRAKARLFIPTFLDSSVINTDDPYGRLLADTAATPVHPYSLDDVDGLLLGPSSSEFTWRGLPVRLPLGGRFNVSNAIAAATTASVLGVADEAIAAALTGAPQTPGRFEVIDHGQPFSVIVDFAHSPDGLERLLEAARPLGAANSSSPRLVVVFGCGGDRDRDKRPLMGEIAGRLADVVILTNDNPRSEDPLAIIESVRRGMRHAEKLTIEPDRRSAILDAIAGARPGDTVVIAGKGHERGQERDGVIEAFDDRDEARSALTELGFLANAGRGEPRDRTPRPCA